MRFLSSLAVWVPAVAAAVALATYLFLAISSRRMPELQPWHTLRLEGEFRARDSGADADLADYLEHERRVFEQLEAATSEFGSSELPLGRYQPGGRNNPATFPVDWNRSFELRPPETSGAALLLHGLTDSPYSLRRIGEILYERGFYVLGLRLPGHGTVPAAIADATLSDWRAAVRIAARHARAQVGPEAPFWIAGYSNGGALALDHAIAAILEPSLGRPDRLVLLSPAVGITRFAAFARWHRPLSMLPMFEKFRWNTIYPEHDPFKYNSFPNSAAYQTHRLTRELRNGLDRLQRARRLGELPPLLTFQSAADSTVRTGAVLDDLFGRLRHSDSELVIFDINRVSYMKAYFATEPSLLWARLCEPPGPPFRLTLITNADSESQQVVARSWSPGSVEPVDQALDLEWPAGVFSLSHVSVPFPPDDPIYGAGTVPPPSWGVPLGSLEPRGERDLLAVPIDLFTRLRYNPFFPYVERRIRELPGP